MVTFNCLMVFWDINYLIFLFLLFCHKFWFFTDTCSTFRYENCSNIFSFTQFRIYIFCIFLHFKQYDNMFYNDLCLTYEKLQLILPQPAFLLDFCFNTLDFSATQLAHFANCLISLFVIFTFLSQYYQHVFRNEFSTVEK